MQTKQLGPSDLHLTPIGFGAWAIGVGGWAFGASKAANLRSQNYRKI